MSGRWIVETAYAFGGDGVWEQAAGPFMTRWEAQTRADYLRPYYGARRVRIRWVVEI